MGFLAEVALFLFVLIGAYAGLHDFLGLNIIPYGFFDSYLAAAFVASLFILVVSLSYWLYRLRMQPLKKKALKIVKIAILVFALGIFFTAIPSEANSTVRLLFGKLLLIIGLAVGYLAIEANKRCIKSSEKELNEEKERLV